MSERGRELSTKMSKLSFRARALDAMKPVTIYTSEELPDLSEFTAINRSVPQMPSGMEKEEESEHHLQRAICTGLIIPTPEVYEIEDMQNTYEKLYASNYKLPRQLIHVQPLAMEQDIPDYDVDSEDEQWLIAQSTKMDLDHLKFEKMMDTLEKSSGQNAVKLEEAKPLLNEDDDIITAVYDYWLTKRLNVQHHLIPLVKTENRIGTSANNPYVAFRRRVEKMQTRKNRKNDENSFESMLKLKRDFLRTVTLLELCKKREKTKREAFRLSIEIFEKRYMEGDYSGQLLSEATNMKTPRVCPKLSVNYQTSRMKFASKDNSIPRKEKRQYKKRKYRGSNLGCGRRAKNTFGSATTTFSTDSFLPPRRDTVSSEDGLSHGHSVSDEEVMEGQFSFRRKLNCNYLQAIPEAICHQLHGCRNENSDNLYMPNCKFQPSILTEEQTLLVRYTRRRIGRGGRVLLDRLFIEKDQSTIGKGALHKKRAYTPRHSNGIEWLDEGKLEDLKEESSSDEVDVGDASDEAQIREAFGYNTTEQSNTKCARIHPNLCLPQPLQSILIPSKEPLTYFIEDNYDNISSKEDTNKEDLVHWKMPVGRYPSTFKVATVGRQSKDPCAFSKQPISTFIINNKYQPKPTQALLTASSFSSFPSPPHTPIIVIAQGAIQSDNMLRMNSVSSELVLTKTVDQSSLNIHSTSVEVTCNGGTSVLCNDKSIIPPPSVIQNGPVSEERSGCPSLVEYFHQSSGFRNRPLLASTDEPSISHYSTFASTSQFLRKTGIKYPNALGIECGTLNIHENSSEADRSSKQTCADKLVHKPSLPMEVT